MKKLIVLLCAFVVAACAQTREAAQAPAAPRNITILISIDGFRPDYLSAETTPTLARLAETGVSASMRPSFPSVTFPNHYTLITGRRPDRSGQVNNRMEDAERPGVLFAIWDRVVAADPIWWQDATPLWVTAERAGVRTGTMFWPGSDYELHGARPSKWRLFDQSMPGFARVDTLLSWLDLPEAERPVFFTLYFDIVDTMGHRYGPRAMETASAAAEVDAALARLQAGLAARGYGAHANLVIVADHGMTDVSDDRIISLDAAAPAADARVVWDGPNAGVTPLAGKEAKVEAALLGRSEHGECWRKSELPARFHYGTHRRVPAIVCLADLGWRYRSSQIPPYATPSLGAHGYDPEAPEMAALFVANGPAFKGGVTLPSFDNVSVYPLLVRLIGVAPEDNDGALSDVAPALR